MPSPSFPFDVNDERSRTQFLRGVVPGALPLLHDRMLPAWGRMSPQQMVEHLAWGFDLANGAQATHCPVPEEKRDRMKLFLSSNQPSPRDFMNPVLVSGLPPLRYPSLDAAKEALGEACNRFLEQPTSAADVPRVHPLFGPLGREEWSRVHVKHVFHHLMQFGLITAARPGVAAGSDLAPRH